jgi:hypothetical protein
MTTQMINQIKSALSSMASRSSIYSKPTAPDKIYEIYVLSCVVQALKNLGCTLEARTHLDATTTTFDFRLSPGYIYSPAIQSSFVHITYGTKEYELHNGVRTLGSANVLHELDVAIINREEAVRCRLNRIHPRQSQIKFLAECKFYGSVLPLNLGREFLGLCTEFTARAKSLVSNVGSDNIHKLVTSHRQTESFNLSPINSHQVDVFTKWLEKELSHSLSS